MLHASAFLTRVLRTGASLLLLKYGTPVDSHQVRIETEPRDADVSLSVELTRDHDDLIATGCVRPRFGSSNLPLWRTVQLRILNPQGKLFAESRQRCALIPSGSPRTSTSTKRWPFQVRFNGMPPQGSTIRVTW